MDAGDLRLRLQSGTGRWGLHTFRDVTRASGLRVASERDAENVPQAPHYQFDLPSHFSSTSIDDSPIYIAR